MCLAGRCLWRGYCLWWCDVVAVQALLPEVS